MTSWVTFEQVVLTGRPHIAEPRCMGHNIVRSCGLRAQLPSVHSGYSQSYYRTRRLRTADCPKTVRHSPPICRASRRPAKLGVFCLPLTKDYATVHLPLNLRPNFRSHPTLIYFQPTRRSTLIPFSASKWTFQYPPFYVGILHTKHQPWLHQIHLQVARWLIAYRSQTQARQIGPLV